MNEILISQFVDDELDLDEKVEFVETVHDSAGFKNQTVEFLNLEKYIRADAVDRIPEIDIEPIPRSSWARFHPWRIVGAGLAAAGIALILFFAVPQETRSTSPYRFVLYKPDASQVEISGSFTDWQAMPMRKTGFSGYWETTVELPEGEHRFSYIIEGREHIPDPTIIIREKDDFGGVNYTSGWFGNLKNVSYWLAVFIIFLAGCSTHHHTVDREEVTLYLQVGKAREVNIAYSLDQFRYRPVQRVDADTWAVRVPADRSFTYFYLVDGEVYLPDCRLKETDDFGSENCIYVPGM